MKKYVVIPAQRSKEDKDKINELCNSPECANLSKVAIEILYNRGFDTVKKIERHLYSNIEDFHDTLLLKDSDKFIEELIDAHRNNYEITIYGDYDVDGAIATGIGCLGLSNIGLKVNYYANNRFDEGYGITPGGVVKMLEKYPNTKMIITVDNGIVAFDGINKANELGLKVLVTDHHEPAKDGSIPNALAVVDAKRLDCNYPFKELCGAGLIFKLMLLLYQVLDLDTSYIYELLDMTALATVADMVPLIDENRIIVKEGLKYHRTDNRKAFKILRESLNKTIVDEDVFGYTYGPIINALGRISGCPSDAVELFITQDEDRMKELVQNMVDLNEERKELTKEQTELAENMVMDYLSKHKKLPYVLVLRDQSFHEGVVGLVAGRLKEKFNRPTIILSPHSKEGNSIWKGSGRSILGLNLKKTLDDVSDTLLGYGGHEMAGGLSVSDENFDLFVERINEVASKTLTDEMLLKKVNIDTVLNSRRLTFDMIESVELLKPFGMGFVKPQYGFIAPNCSVYYMKKKLTDEELLNGYTKEDMPDVHIKLKQDNISLLGFNMVDKYRRMGCPTNVKITGTPSLNVFNGNTSIQIIIDDMELGSRSLTDELFKEDFEEIL